MASFVFGAAVTQAVADEKAIDFQIPSQPLPAALVRFGDATGNEALYEGQLTDGRVSGAAEGRLTPAEALRRLLDGTGLVARFVAEGTFVLQLAPQPRSTQSPAHRRYYALVQDAVLQAMCRLPEARPGGYRLVTSFWITADGAVEDMLRVGSVGQAATDQLIDRTLRGLRFGEPPPAGFLQPVRVLFVPQGPGVNAGCTIPEDRRRTLGAAR